MRPIRLPSRYLRLSLVIIASLTLSPAVRAAQTLGTGAFAYGARLDVEGRNPSQAIEIAAHLELDWIAMEFDWGRTWPEPGVPPDLDALARATRLAQARHLPVMLTVTNPPDWALTPGGPDAAITTGLLMDLVRRYPGVGAIELFPGANTSQGWGARPDPHAYMNLYSHLQATAIKTHPELILVAAGLIPLDMDSSTSDMDDLLYLQGLYQAGGAESLNVISLQFPDLTGDPMASPFEGSARVLRHFEKVRHTMLENDHEYGLVWVTRLSWPSGKIAIADGRYRDPRQQARWLYQAFDLLSSQLYVGAAFFDSLNPAGGSDPNRANPPSLLYKDMRLHPGIEYLRQLTSLTVNIPSTEWETATSKKLFSPKKLLKPVKR